MLRKNAGKTPFVPQDKPALPLRLFVAQGDHGVDAHGAARGDEACG